MASADGTATPNKDEMSAQPLLCVKDCGFFGNASTGGMCSKCYKETLAKSHAVAAAPPAEPKVVATPPPAAAAPAPSAATSAEKPAVTTAAAAAASSSAAPPDVSDAATASTAVCGVARPSEETPEGEEPPKKVQVNTSRCWTCNRKIGLLGFQCKCEYYFCAEHRYSDKHECAFDFKTQARKQLEKQNPTIAPSKMETM